MIEVFTLIGLLVVFLVLVILLGYHFGIITFTVSNELTGKSKTFKSKEK